MTVANTLLHENDYAYDIGNYRKSNTVSLRAIGSSTVLPQMDGSGNPILTTVRAERYDYDNLQRLSHVGYGDGETQSYAFDARGNRVTNGDIASGTGGGTTSESYSVDAANRLTSRKAGGTSTAVTSDAAGNTLSDDTRTNTWDSENRLTHRVSAIGSGSTSQFTYGTTG